MVGYPFATERLVTQAGKQDFLERRESQRKGEREKEKEKETTVNEHLPTSKRNNSGKRKVFCTYFLLLATLARDSGSDKGEFWPKLWKRRYEKPLSNDASVTCFIPD